MSPLFFKLLAYQKLLFPKEQACSDLLGRFIFICKFTHDNYQLYYGKYVILTMCTLFPKTSTRVHVQFFIDHILSAVDSINENVM